MLVITCIVGYTIIYSDFMSGAGTYDLCQPELVLSHQKGWCVSVWIKAMPASSGLINKGYRVFMDEENMLGI